MRAQAGVHETHPMNTTKVLLSALAAVAAVVAAWAAINIAWGLADLRSADGAPALAAGYALLAAIGCLAAYVVSRQIFASIAMGMLAPLILFAAVAGVVAVRCANGACFN